MRFAAECFFKYALPRFHVGSHVIEFCAVDLYANWRRWWSVKYGMEGDVSAQPMRKKQTSNYTFMDNIQSTSIMQTKPMRIRSAQTRIQDKFPQSSHSFVVVGFVSFNFSVSSLYCCAIFSYTPSIYSICIDFWGLFRKDASILVLTFDYTPIILREN